MNSVNDQLSLAPLGAGDLIDRAVRMYPQHFFTLIRIAAPPVLVSALGWTITTIAAREVGATSDDFRLALYIFMIFAGIAIIFAGSLFSVIVIGGATRNLVAHLLSNEPVSARATYRAVKQRFWSLLGASFLVGLWLLVAMSAAAMVGMMLLWFVLMIFLVASMLFSLVATIVFA